MIPKNFSLHTTATGLRKTKKDDLLAILCPENTTVCGMFTQNTFLGAPVVVTKNRLQKSEKCRAILVNSGVANVATGEKGILDAEECAKILAENFSISAEEVLVASTGRIGDFLPMENFRQKIPELAKCQNVEMETAASAIMTTDLVPKYISVSCGNATISGIAKGSGMIEPNMATMLAFVMTDAKMEHEKMQKIWKKCVEKSFNMLSVDACESTSDMALLLSSQTVEVNEKMLEEKILDVCETLAKKIARDGEGATCLVEAKIMGAKTEEDAKKLAKSIIKSDLLKCAIHGKDLNWGRIMGAVGSTHIAFDIRKCSCSLDGVKIFSNGRPTVLTEQEISSVFLSDTVNIELVLEEGNYSATAWGCDLSHGYVDINALYRT